LKIWSHEKLLSSPKICYAHTYLLKKLHCPPLSMSKWHPSTQCNWGDINVIYKVEGLYVSLRHIRSPQLTTKLIWLTKRTFYSYNKKVIYFWSESLWWREDKMLARNDAFLESNENSSFAISLFPKMQANCSL
jgi:hypothetical protein